MVEVSVKLSAFHDFFIGDFLKGVFPISGSFLRVCVQYLMELCVLAYSLSKDISAMFYFVGYGVAAVFTRFGIISSGKSPNTEC